MKLSETKQIKFLFLFIFFLFWGQNSRGFDTFFDFYECDELFCPDKNENVEDEGHLPQADELAKEVVISKN